MAIEWANGIVNEAGWDGSGYKYAIQMEADGFDMDADDWTVTVKKGKKTIEFTKENSTQDSEGQWYICVDSTLLGTGTFEIVYDAFVPDDDFPDGIRHEVIKQELIINQKI